MQQFAYEGFEYDDSDEGFDDDDDEYEGFEDDDSNEGFDDDDDEYEGFEDDDSDNEGFDDDDSDNEGFKSKKSKAARVFEPAAPFALFKLHCHSLAITPLKYNLPRSLSISAVT